MLPGSTEPSDQGEQAISGRRHDIMEAVWFTFKTGIFAGRDTLSKLEMDALADWLNVLVDLLPAGKARQAPPPSFTHTNMVSRCGTHRLWQRPHR